MPNQPPLKRKRRQDPTGINETFFVLPFSQKAYCPGLENDSNMLVISTDYQLTKNQIKTKLQSLNDDGRAFTGREKIFSRYEFNIWKWEPENKRQYTTPGNLYCTIQIKIEDAIAWQPGLYLKYFNFHPTNIGIETCYKIDINVTIEYFYRLKNFANALQAFLREQATHLSSITIWCIAEENRIFISYAAYSVFLAWRTNLSKEDNIEEFLKNKIKFSEVIDCSTYSNLNIIDFSQSTSTTSNLSKFFTIGTPINVPSQIRFNYPTCSEPIYSKTTANPFSPLPSAPVGQLILPCLPVFPFPHIEVSPTPSQSSSPDPTLITRHYVFDANPGLPWSDPQPSLQNNSIFSVAVTPAQSLVEVEREIDKFLGFA